MKIYLDIEIYLNTWKKKSNIIWQMYYKEFNSFSKTYSYSKYFENSRIWVQYKTNKYISVYMEWNWQD